MEPVGTIYSNMTEDQLRNDISEAYRQWMSMQVNMDIRTAILHLVTSQTGPYQVGSVWLNNAFPSLSLKVLELASRIREKENIDIGL
jgi:hypothetical protein